MRCPNRRSLPRPKRTIFGILGSLCALSLRPYDWAVYANWLIAFGVAFVISGLGLGLSRPLWLARWPSVAWLFGVSPWEATQDSLVRRLARGQVALGALALFDAWIGHGTWADTAYAVMWPPFAYAIGAALARFVSYRSVQTS